jgi:hypothetical protein
MEEANKDVRGSEDEVPHHSGCHDGGSQRSGSQSKRSGERGESQT